MTRKIFNSICLVTLLVLLGALVLIMGVLYDYFSSNQLEQLRIQTQLAAQAVSNEGMAYFDGLDTSTYRISWIENDGSVIYDSQASADSMENHLDRQEIQDALASGYGESSRYSSTLTERMLYSAMLLPDGTIIRLSSAQYTMLTLVLAILQPVLVVFFAAAVLALILASRLSKKIVGPLNNFDLDKPLSNTAYPELEPMLQRLDSQQKQLRSHAAQLRRRQEELAMLTDNMREGFVLLNEKGRILSINHQAAGLLGIAGAEGESIYTSGCCPQVLELVDKARGGMESQTVLELGDGSFRFNAYPIMCDCALTGLGLIIMDVTEKERSEQLRREFSANVSHELKTPLHAISGCAELLKNGMVKPEDVQRFSEQIYSQSQRMISLVEDIIKLSRLDEGGENLQTQPVDLYPLAQQVIESLSPAAEKAGVSLRLNGSKAVVQGVPQLLQGIIFNLCDNGIKYNRRGGSVEIELDDGQNYVQLSVRDTGIGIAAQDQERIFERFYRVDKSHSKEVGGTGLGLSIVKHSARLHNAKLSLESKEGEGTCISLLFPKNNT